MLRRIRAAPRHHHNSRYSFLGLMSYYRDQKLDPSELLKDDSAEALVAELGSCLTELEVNGNFFGRFSFTVVLHDTDRVELDRKVAECFKTQSRSAELSRAWAPSSVAASSAYSVMIRGTSADLPLSGGMTIGSALYGLL